MEDWLVPLAVIVCVFVVLPWMVLRHIERRRPQRSCAESAAGPQPASADLLRTAQRMEQRIEALEKILDAEVPGWRNRHHD